jgi:hypothetical protein
MKLNNISELIQFLEAKQITDFDTINKLVFSMTGKSFFPIRFTNRQPTPLAYYVKWLRKYEIDIALKNPLGIYIDWNEDFKITDIYKTNDV